MRYALQKLGQFAIVFFIVTFVVMILMRLGLNAPGDPARTLLGGTADQALIDATTAKYRLDSNYFTQYFFWLKGMVTGDMGFSVPNSQPVSSLISGRVMTTLLLGFYAIVWGLIISVPFAVPQAYERDSWFATVRTGAAFAFVSAPAIVLAPIVTLVLIKENTIGLPGPLSDYQITFGGWFPRVGDKVYPWQDLGEHFRNFFVPTRRAVGPWNPNSLHGRVLAGLFARCLEEAYGDEALLFTGDRYAAETKRVATAATAMRPHSPVPAT